MVGTLATAGEPAQACPWSGNEAQACPLFHRHGSNHSTMGSSHRAELAHHPVQRAGRGQGEGLRVKRGCNASTPPGPPGAPQQVNALEFMPGSTNLAVAGFNHIKLFDLASQSTEPVRSAGRGLLPGCTARLLPPPALQLAKFEGHKNNITAVGFHRDGKWMFSGSEDGTVKVWDIRWVGREPPRLLARTPSLPSLLTPAPQRQELPARLHTSRPSELRRAAPQSGGNHCR